MFAQGPHLRGAIEDVGFAGAMGRAAKATLVAAAMEKAVPMAAEGLAKMCPRRAPPAVADGNNALPIEDTPSPGSPSQQFVNGKINVANHNDDDKTIDLIGTATIIISIDNPILRPDREFKSVLDKERTTTIELVGVIVGKAIEMLMIEQRTETNRQDEN